MAVCSGDYHDHTRSASNRALESNSKNQENESERDPSKVKDGNSSSISVTGTSNPNPKTKPTFVYSNPFSSYHYMHYPGFAAPLFPVTSMSGNYHLYHCHQDEESQTQAGAKAETSTSIDTTFNSWNCLLPVVFIVAIIIYIVWLWSSSSSIVIF